MPYPSLKKRRASRPSMNEQQLARCLLMVIDRLDWDEQEQSDLYNTLKPLAEDTLRGDVSRETQSTNSQEDLPWPSDVEG